MNSTVSNTKMTCGHMVWKRTSLAWGLKLVAAGCGLPNETFHSGCVVCGKSYTDIKEEIMLGYLEQTHVAGETYEHRIAGRDAFQAGLKAVSFILVPRGVSQTAACDGTPHQVIPETKETSIWGLTI